MIAIEEITHQRMEEDGHFLVCDLIGTHTISSLSCVFVFFGVTSLLDDNALFLQ